MTWHARLPTQRATKAAETLVCCAATGGLNGHHGDDPGVETHEAEASSGKNRGAGAHHNIKSFTLAPAWQKSAVFSVMLTLGVQLGYSASCEGQGRGQVCATLT